MYLRPKYLLPREYIYLGNKGRKSLKTAKILITIHRIEFRGTSDP